MKINLNDEVRIGLTEKGIEVWNKSSYSVTSKITKGSKKYRGVDFPTYILTEQLWVIMKVFGSYMANGLYDVFYPLEVEIIEEIK